MRREVNVLRRARRGTLAALAALFLAIGCAERSPTSGPGDLDAAALVVTTDYQVGAYSAMRVHDREVRPTIELLHQDAICRFDPITGRHFVVARLGADAIDVIDPAQGWAVAREYSVGPGTNPQDIAVVAPDRALVPRYQDPLLLVVHPLEGTELGTIDLSPYADADGIPEAAWAVVRGDEVFVALQRLDNYQPTDFSSVLVLDATSGTVEDEIRLAGNNLFAKMRHSTGVDRITIGESGRFQALDGGLELIDPVTRTASGYVITEAALGGDITDVVVLSATQGYAVVAGIDDPFATRVLRFDPAAGEVRGELAAGSGFDHAFIELSPDGSQLWVTDRTEAASGVQVFDTATDAEITSGPVGVGLPPFMVCFGGEDSGGDADSDSDTDSDSDCDTDGDSDPPPEPSDLLDPCTPRAPVLDPIHAGAELHFRAAGDPAIQVGTADAPDATAPDAWSDGDRLTLEPRGQDYAIRVFARVDDPACDAAPVFVFTYHVVVAYPGPAGQADSAAILADDPRIARWAAEYVEPVAYGAEVSCEWRTPGNVLGPVVEGEPSIVSLGRAGAITLSFDPAIADGEGPDLAVFENAFNDTLLELARIEVSSDGETFIRFDHAYLGLEPVGPYGEHLAGSIGGLAGTVRQGFGTPFDLAVLRPRAEVLDGAVDLGAITHVRIRDVVGDGAARDSFGNPIYDPYPTSGSAGFDLDGVAVLR